jgi:hypothetical protein
MAPKTRWSISHKYGNMCFVRTTVDIPDSLYRDLKSKAAEEGRSVKELVLRGVEAELRPRPRGRGRPVSLPLIRSKKPGTIELDNAKIFEIIPFP